MLKAMHNYVVVKVDDHEIKEHASGLALSASQTEVACTGVITSMGPSVRAPEFAVGVKVLIPPGGVGEDYLENLVLYKVLLDHEIYGVIRAETT